MHGPLRPKEISRISALPPISRARGNRLYGLDGSRWLDCWVGGSGLLGHRPNGVSQRLKSEIDRGLYAPYPNLWTRRLEKALFKLFPGYRALRIYRNTDQVLAALGNESPVDPLDLDHDVERIEGAAWGRPLLPGHPAADFLLPVLPVPGLSEIQALLFSSEKALGGFPPSDLVSPMILAALTRSCAGLEAGNAREFGEIADIWVRRGPYMCYRGDYADYDGLFDSFFERRILIAPSPSRPSLFPLELSNGERAALAKGGFR